MERLKKSEKEIWNELHKGSTSLSPIQDFILELTTFFKGNNVQNVLDLACGTGQYLIHLLKKGFSVQGLDISEEAINIVRNLMEAQNFNAKLFVGSMFERFPHEDDYFDALICIRALNHGTIEQIRACIKEIERVLKPEGLIFMTVRKKGSKRKRLPFRELSRRTYIPLEGAEKGIIHYLFNRKILRTEFRHFQIIYLKTVYGPKSWESYYHLLAKLRNS